MEHIISLCAGSLFKIVDEIDDTHYTSLLDYKLYIQTLCTLFISLWLYNDVYISLLLIFVIPLCFSTKQIDTDYWRSLIPIPFLTFLFKMGTLEYDNVIEKIITYSVMILLIVTDALFFPEEVSTVKIIARCFVIIMLAFGIYIWQSNDLLKGVGLFGIGYLLTSILFKTVFAQEEPAKQPVEQ
jgi:hypothetical protein